MNRKRLIPLLILLVIAAVAAYYYFEYIAVEDDGALTASGTVEALQVIASAELSGRVAEVYVSEGQLVSEGAALFKLEDDLLTAQQQRAQAALEAAQAGYQAAIQSRQTAQTAYDATLLQHQISLAAARAADATQRRAAWQAETPDEFSTPVWYFVKSETLAATEAEIAAAETDLQAERASFERVIADASNADLVAAEQRLAEAQAAFRIAQDVLERAQAQNDEQVDEYAQSVFDTAQSELDAAQLAYDQILSEQATQDVLEARARLTVAQERYDTALDYRDALLTGAESLPVQAAQAALRQAEAQLAQVEANIAQAETAIAQAQAELDLLAVQMEKLTVTAAISGVVLSRAVEPGEVIQAGAPALTLGQLSDLTLTVYLPEDRYGQVSLGQLVEVAIDSFPGQTFRAAVTRIADQAEFTPRNVQTAEGRRTTVFAVELAVEDPQGVLKPGMPADVTFGQ